MGLLSAPKDLSFNRHPYALVLNVRKFWWEFGYIKGARAMAIGHTVLLGPNVENKDLEHELVHVEQYARVPLVYPVLYYIEFFRKGYRMNKYEDEAYRRAGNIYKGK